MVTVSLTGASKEDATTVFDVLRTAFPAERAAADILQEQEAGHPVVWTAEFEPTREHPSTPAAPTPLEGSLTATLQGGYVAVDRLCEALGAAFAVHEEGTASGDQEKEVDLRLGTKGR
ncbi:hypothetical protein [Streptomyces sp. NPDC059466]|uniref:hypothetical protein n=1 Tax=unclassified Streptomyces TaxID=2593676 RepID=UPI0036B60DB6